ncbi:MAG: peptide chain release factor N(5)-glutamine methyltransferase [Muribaculaceae bacterium]|nr:peptide chain release factor N(5)-glutamine methyltransferase [Muribaculaceae bacterium]
MTVNEASAFFKCKVSEVVDGREAAAMWRLVMSSIMGYEPVDLILRGDHELPEFVPSRIQDIVSRLLAHEPIQYILGEACFYGYNFTVSKAVLIPRPETEQLVDMIVDENKGNDLRVLDVGTGSGCIAVSLALNLKWPIVTAVDISQRALEIAQKNAERNKAKVQYLQADALRLGALPCEPLDIIVSNPPYVCYNEMPGMESNVLDYEPHTALFVPDDDPQLFYRAIARYAQDALKSGGRLYFECNRAYADDTARMLVGMGFDDVRVHLDTFGNRRFVTATR